MADADWVARTADRVLTAMEEHRSTWQIGMSAPKHNGRSAAVERAPPSSVSAGRPAGRRGARAAGRCRWPRRTTRIDEPAALRRSDGSSVYTVAGCRAVHLDPRILDAEQRLVSTAGRNDGQAVVDEAAVDLALLRGDRQRGRPGGRAGRAGPPMCDLGGAASAGDCAGRHRKNDRDAGPALPPGPKPAARCSASRRRPPPPPV